MSIFCDSFFAASFSFSLRLELSTICKRKSLIEQYQGSEHRLQLARGFADRSIYLPGTNNYVHSTRSTDYHLHLSRSSNYHVNLSGGFSPRVSPAHFYPISPPPLNKSQVLISMICKLEGFNRLGVQGLGFRVWSAEGWV